MIMAVIILYSFYLRIILHRHLFVIAGNNFMRWSRNVRRTLIAKNKEGFINGNSKMPDEKDTSFQKWKQADYMVMSWILSSISSEFADEYGFIENSAEFVD